MYIYIPWVTSIYNSPTSKVYNSYNIIKHRLMVLYKLLYGCDVSSNDDLRV